jgi:hypothetical protein
MRAFILTLALPLALAACAESPQEEAMEEGAPPGDMEDVVGDGEIIDEPGEPEGNMFTGADTDGDGMLNADEFGAGWADVDMTTVDTDDDGMVSQAEYDAYMAAHPGM